MSPRVAWPAPAPWAGVGWVVACSRVAAPLVLQGVLVSGNQAQGGTDSQQSVTGQGLGGGVYVDPSASVTADMETLIAGNQASKSNNDVWGTISIVP